MLRSMSERNMLTTEDQFRILRWLEQDPATSQRQLARELGISVGKVNYCLKALLEKGFVKARNFRNSQDKTAYLYKLTPKGLEEKACLTIQFLEFKLKEYESLGKEIEDLQREARRVNTSCMEME
jgi:EPS-associated MarR family transcriptional regulator